MNRIEAMKIIVNALPEFPIVANCGATSRELAAIRYSHQHLYILDSMGLASSVGLGLALALADTTVERVVVLEGDGALLMNFNSLASIAYHRPDKLLLIVLDNAAYASTGGQPTYTHRLDLAAMAEAAGLKTLTATTAAALKACLDEQASLNEPIFLHVKIEPGNSPDIPLLLEDPAVIAHNFSQWLAKEMEMPRDNSI
ncbi:MAG: thiamine pyrophosphate-dependent enzyme [Chloroflexota bacterium]